MLPSVAKLINFVNVMKVNFAIKFYFSTRVNFADDIKFNSATGY